MKALYSSLALIVILFACSREEDKTINDIDDLKNEPHIAKVIDKIEVKGYNYLQVSENKEDYWIAVPTMDIQVGETVYFSKFMVMKGFKSETINRTFDNILFIEDARKSATPQEMKNIHSGSTTVEKQDISIEPLSDGLTIEKIFEVKSTLNEKLVKVKGKVVKYNRQIMKRNWIHIQDGTGTEKDYDLVITSQDEVKVGDIIIAEGKLATDKDFGAGYFFSVIIEDAKISKEL
jgi:hypothetical protein